MTDHEHSTLAPDENPGDESADPYTDREMPQGPIVVGNCPEPDCDGRLVSNMYYIRGRGYLTVHECENGLQDDPTCEYRRVK